MTDTEIALWAMAALVLFLGLRTLIRRYPAVRPWVLGAALIYLVGYFTWAMMMPGNWREETALAILFAYALWVGQVVSRARGPEVEDD